MQSVKANWQMLGLSVAKFAIRVFVEHLALSLSLLVLSLTRKSHDSHYADTFNRESLGRFIYSFSWVSLSRDHREIFMTYFGEPQTLKLMQLETNAEFCELTWLYIKQWIWMSGPLPLCFFSDWLSVQKEVLEDSNSNHTKERFFESS